VVLEFDGTLHDQAAADYLIRVMRTAVNRGANQIVNRTNTPADGTGSGGLGFLTRADDPRMHAQCPADLPPWRF
jgi:hypothetical protein